MVAQLRRARFWLALAGLGMLAVGGQLIFNQAVATIGRSQGKPWTVFTAGFDFWPIWVYDQLFVHGQHPGFWYGPGVSNAWPPPHEVLLAPFGFLSYDGAHIASMVATALLMVFAVLLWSRDRATVLTSGWSRIAWPILLSAPVFAVIWIDQLQAAVGLAALSVAIWAQRKDKWWLVGIAASVGMIRLLNAIPVLCILLYVGWRKPWQLGIAVGAAVAFMAPLLAVSYLWDHTFVTDYIAGITAYPFNGPPKAVVHSIGPWGIAVLMLIGCAVALWLVRRDAGKPLDPGRAALVMGLTTALAPVGGLYPAIFVLPALIRLGMRPGFSAVPWIAAVAPWVAIVAVSPWLLGPDPGLTLNFVSVIDYGLLLLAYPLLRIPPEVGRPAANATLASSAA
ncbi:MAG TPA: glycosyltransferase 87 family protein [Candidatus Dormibacteraeota bacterium]|nr:glycosyltransferase 87 family protein [Candidatus Dormibacteraeota bacterium]